MMRSEPENAEKKPTGEKQESVPERVGRNVNILFIGDFSQANGLGHQCEGFGTILTQGGETPGGTGVTAALATGFAAAALTHTGSRDAAPCWSGEKQTDRRTDRQQRRARV